VLGWNYKPPLLDCAVLIQGNSDRNTHKSSRQNLANALPSTNLSIIPIIGTL
jgi:hypothetical protein